MTIYKITLKTTHKSFIIIFSFSFLIKFTLSFIGYQISCQNLDVQISLLFIDTFNVIFVFVIAFARFVHEHHFHSSHPHINVHNVTVRVTFSFTNSFLYLIFLKVEKTTKEE